MSPDLSLFHLNLKDGFQYPALPKGYWHLVTCLRSIVISENPKPVKALESYEFYSGREAFRFLLEVICGLHSPMFGETEVFGQFKDFVSKNRREFGSEMIYVVNSLLQEAKKIRKDYLQNLGCASYGSLLRKHLRSTDQDIHIIGAGSLSQDLLPWLAKSRGLVHVYTRGVGNHRFLMEKYKNLFLKTLDCLEKAEIKGTGTENNGTKSAEIKSTGTESAGVESIGTENNGTENTLERKRPGLSSSDLLKKIGARGILVVAAPVTSQWFSENINPVNFEKIYDLRGESHVDPLGFSNVIPLQALFSDIQENKKETLLIRENVLQSIRDRISKIHPMERQRPFGWEDLWTPHL